MCFWNVHLMHLSIRKSNLSRRMKACAIDMLMVSKIKLYFQCSLQLGKMIKHWFTFQVLSVQSYVGFHHATPVMLVEFLQCPSEGTWASRLQKRLEQRGVAMPVQLCYVQYKEEKITSVFRSILQSRFLIMCAVHRQPLRGKWSLPQNRTYTTWHFQVNQKTVKSKQIYQVLLAIATRTGNIYNCDNAISCAQWTLWNHFQNTLGQSYMGVFSK